MAHTAWQDGIDATQLALRAGPDRCFVCGWAVAADQRGCAVEAFADAAHTKCLAVVCERMGCLRVLADSRSGTWQRLFQAVSQWPDPALYPLGPYWRMPSHQRFAFRTPQRRTTYRG